MAATSQNTTRFSNNFQLKDELEKGEFSIVRRCVQKSTQFEFASKLINTKKLSLRGMINDNLMDNLQSNVLNSTNSDLIAISYIKNESKCNENTEFDYHYNSKDIQIFPKIWLEDSEYGCVYHTKFESDYTKHHKNHDTQRKKNRKSLNTNNQEKNLIKRKNIWRKVSLSGSQTFKCNQENCSGTFRTSRGLARHIFFAHGGQGILVCDVDGCNYYNANVTKMRNHLERHRGERNYRCNINDCNKTFVTKQDLFKHKQRHSTEKRYSCVWPGCERHFTTSDNLWQHHKYHNRILIYQCEWPECDYSTEKKWNFDIHKTKHTGKLKFACVWVECGYKTANQCNLKKHIKIHKCI